MIVSLTERICFVKKTLIFTVALFLLTACSSVPRFTSAKQTSNVSESKTPLSVRYKPEKKEVAEDTISFADPGNEKVLATEIGVASYYAEPFVGRRTANGEIYDKYELTAAHPTFPLGTIARVTNLKNGKTAIIRINDRMPKRPDRIIDLSYGTAVILDMVKDGITKVKLEVLKWGDNKYHSIR